MRDPARIDRMIEQLWRLWRRQPDTRLAQLVCNLASAVSLTYHLDPFHCEDAGLEVAMGRILDEGQEEAVPQKMTLPGGAVVEVKSVARGGQERRPVTPEEMDAELVVGEPCPTCGHVVKQRAYRARKKGA